MYCLPREDLVVVIFTARKRSLGQGNIFTQFVILFTGGGVCLSACLDTTTPREQTPPRADPPWSRPPPAQSMLGDTVNARTVRILLECNLVAVISLKCLPDFRRPVV